MKFVDIDSLKHISLYEARANENNPPRITGEGRQEIEVIVSGKGYFIRDGERYDIRPGDMVWFYPGDVVDACADGEKPYKTIVFAYWIGESTKKRPPFHSSWKNLDECVDFCQRALRRYLFGVYDDAFVECAYSRLYWESIESDERRKSRITGIVEKAAEYIQNHYMEDINIQEIAKQVGVSASHLYLLWRRKYGEAPIQMVIRLRLRKAESLLLYSDLSVKEISGECGFNNINHFCYSFKKARGISPGAFRRRG